MAINETGCKEDRKRSPASCSTFPKPLREPMNSSGRQASEARGSVREGDDTKSEGVGLRFRG